MRKRVGGMPYKEPAPAPRVALDNKIVLASENNIPKNKTPELIIPSHPPQLVVVSAEFCEAVSAPCEVAFAYIKADDDVECCDDYCLPSFFCMDALNPFK